MRKQVNLTLSGQSLITDDINQLGGAAHLDDDVFQEAVRLSGQQYGIFAGPGPIVVPSATSGYVVVQHFRACMAPKATVRNPSLSNDDTYRGLASAIFTDVTAPETTGIRVSFPSNILGVGPRLDLIYATLILDTPVSATQRKVRDPSTLVITTQNVNPQRQNLVQIHVAVGTASATPTVPSLPANGTTTINGELCTYVNIQLAVVRVPDGFIFNSTAVADTDIVETAPRLQLRSNASIADVSRPGSGGLVSAGSTSRSNWAVNGTPFPYHMLGNVMGSGVEHLMFQLDMTGTAPGGASIVSGDVIDGTRDYRNRFFLVFASVANNGANAGDVALSTVKSASNTSTLTVPQSAVWLSGQLGGYATMQFSSSCNGGTNLVSPMTNSGPGGGPVISYLDNSTITGLTGGPWLLYVDRVSGVLHAAHDNAGVTPPVLCYWIMMTPQFDNLR